MKSNIIYKFIDLPEQRIRRTKGSIKDPK